MTPKIVNKVALGLVTIAAIVLSGCATTDEGLSQKNTQWEGKEAASVIQEWGVSENKAMMSDGSEVWTYRTTKQATIGDQAPATTTRKERTESYVVNGVTMTRQVPYDETSYDPTKILSSDCVATFTIKDGVVKSAKFEGNGCE